MSFYMIAKIGFLFKESKHDAGVESIKKQALVPCCNLKGWWCVYLLIVIRMVVLYYRL